MNRRSFLGKCAAGTVSLGVSMIGAGCRSTRSASYVEPAYKISLAEWSLHRAIRDQQYMSNLDFPKVARRKFDIDAVEYVNQFFMDRARDQNYLRELNRICDGEGVRSLLIMCDREGALGAVDGADRDRAVENHKKWADAAKTLGCHSIRVDAKTGDVGSPDEQQKRMADGLAKLSEYCLRLRLSCLVENDGGLSSNANWLAGLIKRVDMSNCGTLPDFGNFQISETESYDRYQGVEELMPFAKAVSAKATEFDDEGNELNTDFLRMMKIVTHHGYNGYVGIESECKTPDEYEGIRLTKALLERVREELTQN